MMSWLRTTSLSLARQLSRSLDPHKDYEPQACYSSFCKHWQQAHDIIAKSQPQHLYDDVLGVVNHLEQLATLLVFEARAREIETNITNGNPASCLEYLLSQNLLDKLYEWAVCTGRYENVVRLEQLKLFGNLISHYSSQVIAAEPFLRPLLKLLSGFRNELPPCNVESQLVTVLNQLCVTLMQNMKYIDLFFLNAHTHNGSHSEFIIVRLLLSSVHREGGTGSCARDALLLCSKMSAGSRQLADYMLNVSNTCPVLATGLSGLYSLLPRTLSDKTHRLSPDDVNRVHKLTLFIDSLEFCNAVAQVAHPSIKKNLLDLLFQGFLVPVMGPALLQSGAAEQVAATAYLELCLRCVNSRGLLRTVLNFLMRYEYDGVRVVDVLLRRLDGNSQLSLVSLALMETLIDLNCEDVMIELVYRHLQNGNHLMGSRRHKIRDPEPYREASVAFLSLSPRCCSRSITSTRAWAEDLALNGKRILDFRSNEVGPRGSSNGVAEHSIAMNNLVQEVKFSYGNPNETLFGNYHAYLCDARFEIVSRVIACTKWTSRYDSIQQKRETNNNSPTTSAHKHGARELDAQRNEKEQDSLISVCTSGYDTLKTDTSEREQHSLTSLLDNEKVVSPSETQASDCSAKEQDSLTSIGESSGYESFRYRLEEGDEEGFAEDLFWKYASKVEECTSDYDNELPLVRSWRASPESIIGPLLSYLLKKVALLLESDLAQNVRVTGVLSKLVSLPTPLLSSLLLCPGFVLQPNVPSLFQILSKLKEELDELTTGLDNSSELVDKARVYLIQREMSLAKSRAQAVDDVSDHSEPSLVKPDDSPFRRAEPKRRSLSTSFSSMFGRRLSSSSPSPQSPHSTHHTNVNSTPQIPKRHNFTQEAYWEQSITLRSILNAVILDEWVKELAAVAEEHALRLSTEYYEDDVYIQAVSL